MNVVLLLIKTKDNRYRWQLKQVHYYSSRLRTWTNHESVHPIVVSTKRTYRTIGGARSAAHTHARGHNYKIVYKVCLAD